MNKFLKSKLAACESNIKANIGEWKTWDGIMAIHLFIEIERVYGKLWTCHTSKTNLENARRLSTEQPHVQLWDSHFIRELILSAMGGLDSGIFHT